MKITHWAIALGLVASLLGATAGAASADPPAEDPTAPIIAPSWVGNPPLEVQSAPAAGVEPAASQSLAVAPLKAVLVVGPVVDDNSPVTLDMIAMMEMASAAFINHGVKVVKYYTPDNDWDKIKADAKDAQFFLYGGDGVYWPGENVYGGFNLKDGMIPPDRIRKEMKLAPNAIVMINGCFAAGGSGTLGENLSSAEAQYRVASYSDPFFDIGAAGYYADWYKDAFASLVNSLFQGKTLGQAYQSFGDYNAATLETYSHPDHPDLALWLDKGTRNLSTIYSYAFAGRSGSALPELFPPPVIALSAYTVQFLADLDTTSSQHSLTVLNSDWSAQVASGAGWLSVTPVSGAAGGTLTLKIDAQGMTPGTYTGSVVISPPPTATGVSPEPQSVAVTLKIVKELGKVYLPAVIR